MLLSFFMFTSSCGDGLVDYSIVNPFREYEIASGASAIFDAETVTANSNVSTGVCDDTSWDDSSANTNDITITCGTGGKAGSKTPSDPDRIVFDGAVTIAAGAFAPQPTVVQNATWIAWVRPVSATLSQILSMDDGTFDNRSLTVDGDYNVNDGAALWDTNSTVTTGSWQFVALTFSTTNMSLTKNGTKVVFGTAPTHSDTAGPFTIGNVASGGGSEFFEGDVAWVGVYPRVLTDSEIEETCRALVGRFSGASCD